MQYLIINFEAGHTGLWITQKQREPNKEGNIWAIEEVEVENRNIKLIDCSDDAYGFDVNTMFIPVTASSLAAIRSMMAMGRSLTNLRTEAEVFEQIATQFDQPGFRMSEDPLSKFWNHYDATIEFEINAKVRMPYYQSTKNTVKKQHENPNREPTDFDGRQRKKGQVIWKAEAKEHWQGKIKDDPNFTNFELTGTLKRDDAYPLVTPFARLNCWTLVALMLHVSGVGQQLDSKMFNPEKPKAKFPMRSAKAFEWFEQLSKKLHDSDIERFIEEEGTVQELAVLRTPTGTPIFVSTGRTNIELEDLERDEWKNTTTKNPVPSPAEMIAHVPLLGIPDTGKVFMPLPEELEL